ncbi:MAG: serine hydrolase [Clostridia bacterium]|nr:serine hydrolase [Clostridia bacterium]
MLKSEILSALKTIPGDTAVAIQYLDGSAPLLHNEHMPLIAASVIKLGVMLEAFRAFEAGELSKDELFTVRDEDKMPSCGALTYMHKDVQATALDLVTLMIIVSDNTATNLLIERLGIENINKTLASYGLDGIILRRKLFDAKSAARGIQNTVTAAGVLRFYSLLMEEKLVSAESSREMLAILKNQRLKGKMPFFLSPLGIRCAHKTGEDDGTTHDTGVIFTQPACIAVFLSNNVCVPDFERFIQDASLALTR